MAEGSTREGEQGGVPPGQHPDPKQRDDAEIRMNEAPIKTFDDLPDDHPMRRRAEMLAQIAQINDGIDADRAEADATAVAGDETGDTPDLELFRDKTQDKKPPEKKAAPKQDAKSEADEQRKLLDNLDDFDVKVKVDGEERIMPASKVLAQYQKGAAADVRLAKATQAQREAEAALARANAAPAAAAPSTERSTTVVRDTKAAQDRFKEAGEALYAGEPDKAAELFAEAVQLAQAPSSTQNDNVPGDLVERVTNSVTQQLSKQGALNKLFEDYPEIREKRAFALIADEYVAAFVNNGDDIATAIHKAGEAIGEEYTLGHWRQQTEPAKSTDNGRPLKPSATAFSERDSRKKDLDIVPSGNQRATEAREPELTPAQELAQMQAARASGFASGLEQRRQQRATP